MGLKHSLFGGMDQETVVNHMTKADKDSKDLLFYASIGTFIFLRNIQTLDINQWIDWFLLIHIFCTLGGNVLSTELDNSIFSYVPTFIHETRSFN